ncbi:MAG: hypothetical protein P4L85_26600 [Paludisphaera borealis]|uniref:hypothetical protein n=1 Tax=Paludisphaera borealis TaxID=1387353 RepID=UPI00284F2DCC|nr:hypothetical protein [Paludisphaera borealis]MDR3622952.1 hypothetical protein [Paludisphaera borealis]
MTGSEPRGSQVGDVEATRDEWLERLKELVAWVKDAAEKTAWRTRVIEKSMRDSVLGPYKAPALLMQRETVEVILDPIGRFAPGTDGVVDLYLLPAYDDIASLYHADGAWKLHYAFRGAAAVTGIKQADSMPLDAASLNRVLDEITSHAA